MTFPSILFSNSESQGRSSAPEYLKDLNLDQIIDEIVKGREGYNLTPFFFFPLKEIEEIKYRHSVFIDLEDTILLDGIVSFSKKMRLVKENLSYVDKFYYPRQKDRWFLDSVIIYCDALLELLRLLQSANLESNGFLSFRKYLKDYLDSSEFTSLAIESRGLLNELSKIKYSIIIDGGAVTVLNFNSEPDYSKEVEATFAKFNEGAVKDYSASFSYSLEMNHIEAQILDRVTMLFPDVFLRLSQFRTSQPSFLNTGIATFDREVQFYLSYLDYIKLLKESLRFCYPEISKTNKSVRSSEGFDLALAHKLSKEKKTVVCNDFYLEGDERVFVVSGPNQGGKTTFARTFGQLHYLAALGCPIPGQEAKVFLFDRIFTHFEKQENLQSLRGKLEDDLIRVHKILEEATPHSIIIINEIFNSTTLKDAILLGQRVMEKILDLDSLCVCVTFIDELTSLGKKTVSVVSTIVPQNPTQRTFKIVRRQADGLSHAISIAEKYHVTYKQLLGRIP